jgi:hypothetical protein
MDKDKIRKIYEFAQKNKGEDRVTKADLEDAKKALGFKDKVPEIKDYMSKGGNAVKPVKAVLGVLALGALGAKAFSKAKKKTAIATPNNTEYVSNKKNMVTDLYQKATKQKTAKMNMGGEVEVTKGGDYIKDLID